MNKLVYIMKRIMLSIPVLILITLIAFFSIRLVPGDPALTILGDKATAEAVAAFHVKYGLDQNIVIQYFDYMKSLLSMDFGSSLKYNTLVSELLPTRIQVTLLLTLVSFFISVIISFPLSYIAAIFKDRIPDRMICLVSQVGLSIPAFWISLIFLRYFGVKLHLISTAGWGQTWPEHIRSLILPGITQAIGVSAITIRNMRNSIINVKDSEFISFGRSKGIRDHIITWRYLVKNSLIPSITILSMQLVSMIGGSVVVENVYTLPGIGALLVDSIFARDYAIIQTVILFYGIEVLLVFLVTDILYTIVDPRVTLE